MNFLIDGLPDCVTIGGKSVPIVTDFRTGIRFERLILSERMSDEEKLNECLRLYFPQTLINPQDVPDTIDQVLWFYRCGKDKDYEPSGGSGSSEKAFDYDYDAGHIYAAFMQTYSIDLTSCEMHWWQFKALFDALPESTMFIKIVGYRTAEVPEKASAEMKRQIERRKKLYALPLSADQAKIENDLIAVLMNGGNPADILK